MKKRNAGEGSTFQRADGRWCGVVSLGYENGKRCRKCYYGKTAADVRDQLLKARSDHSKGLPVRVERQTLEQFLNSWLEHSLKPSSKPRSYESFRTIINNHIVPALGKIRLEKLTSQHVSALLAAKRESVRVKNKAGQETEKRGLSPQTLVNIRTVLRSALSQALKWNLVTRNVAALVDAPRIPDPVSHALDADQARRLLDTVAGGRFEAIYVIALNLGMRRGEILGLPWANVDFENRTLHVKQAVQRFSGRLQVAELKTKRSKRVIALPDTVLRALKTRRAHQAQERLLTGMRWQNTDLVFTNPIGYPLEPITLHRDFKRALKKSKIDGSTRFHDLRHSAATLLLAQGVHLRVIMELLGHSSISLTANTYTHVMPAAMRDVADKMESVLGAREGG
jgi:integrase